MANIPGLSTLGITVGYSDASGSSFDPKTATYTKLTRINSMGEVAIESETIDASALEDMLTKYIAGRGSVTDTLEIVVNYTDDTETEWNAILGKQVAIETIIPGSTKAFFVLVTVPEQIPQPALDQNGLLTFTMNCVVNDFSKANGYGLQTKVAFQ